MSERDGPSRSRRGRTTATARPAGEPVRPVSYSRDRGRRRPRRGSRRPAPAGSRRRAGSRRLPGAVHDRGGRAAVDRPAVEDQRRCASPSARRSPAASRASGSPETLAEVVGSGPRSRARARGASWSGTRTPIVGAPAGEDPRQDARPGAPGARASARRARTARPAPARAGVTTPSVRGLGRVREQHRDRLLGRTALDREQPLDGVRERHVRGDPVDRVGRDGDDAPGAQQARRPRRGRRRRPGRSASRAVTTRGDPPRRLRQPRPSRHPGRARSRPRAPPAAPPGRSRRLGLEPRRVAGRLLGRRQDERLDQRRRPVLLDRRGDVAAGDPDLGRGGRPSPPRARRPRSSRRR